MSTMSEPCGVAVNQMGAVVTTKYSRNCVSVFGASGENLLTFGERGSGPGEFLGPCRLAVGSEGSILVVDQGNHRIQKFTAEGKFLAAVGAKGSGPLQFDIFCRTIPARRRCMWWTLVTTVFNPEL